MPFVNRPSVAGVHLNKSDVYYITLSEISNHLSIKRYNVVSWLRTVDSGELAKEILVQFKEKNGSIFDAVEAAITVFVNTEHSKSLMQLS